MAAGRRRVRRATPTRGIRPDADSDPRRRSVGVRRFERGTAGVIVAINNNFQACATFEEATPTRRCARRGSAIDDIRPDVAPRPAPDVPVDRPSSTIRCTRNPDRHDAERLHGRFRHRGQMLDLDGVSCKAVRRGCRACIPAGMLAGPLSYRAGRIARALPIPGAGAVRAALSGRGRRAGSAGARVGPRLA